MSKLSPSQKTKRLFEKMGYVVGTVEKINSWAGPPDKKCPACGKNMIGIRQDLFGFADLIAFHPNGNWVTLIQCTSDNNHADRKKKILGLPAAKNWVKTGDCRRIEVVSFKGKKERVERLCRLDFDPKPEEKEEDDF